ncbi:hypothetical protein RCC30_02065 [Pseudomonas fluorescens]|nr:hypothetical protein RCC30_02065 [Pseudomonas fluorescens]
MSVNPRASAIGEFAKHAAKSSLADYWIPTPKSFGEINAQGIRVVQQRQYVAVADGHVVQVVLDAKSGLFRATLASELNPSGPLLKPDSEGRLWVPLDSDVATFTDSISVQTAQLFRRMGHSVTQFSDSMVDHMLAVSGVNESVLRDVLINDRPVPFLLEDTIRRFELDQKIQAQGLGAHLIGLRGSGIWTMHSNPIAMKTLCGCARYFQVYRKRLRWRYGAIRALPSVCICTTNRACRSEWRKRHWWRCETFAWQGPWKAFI